MASFLFVTWAGGGNVAPALGIAAALAGSGCGVEFLGHPEQEETVRARGFGFHPFRRARPWSPAHVLPGMAGAQQTMGVFTDAGIGEDLLELALRTPPDAVVIDHLLWGALKAAPRCGRPHTTLVHTLYGQQRDAWTHGPGAQVARSLGFEPVELWHASRLVLVATEPALDPASSERLPPNVVYTGAVWQGRPGPSTPEAPPVVLVSLSTFAIDGQAAVLQSVLDALAPLPVRVFATTGRSAEALALRPPPNAEVLAYAPHDALMARASLVVSHGGHATATAALSHDVPLLLLPMVPYGDQPEVARLVAAQGASLTLDRGTGIEPIRRAASTLLEDPGYRDSAARLGAAIRRRDGAERASQALRDLVTGGPPREP